MERTRGTRLSSESSFTYLSDTVAADRYRNGVPHVVLPAWQDCYENAARAEWLGIGVYGNKTRAPNINDRELSKALMSDRSYKEKALDLAKLCQKKEGRVAAAEKIVELARNPDLMAMHIPDMKIGDSQCQLSEIRNRSGMTLQSVQLPPPEVKPTAKYISLTVTPLLSIPVVTDP